MDSYLAGKSSTKDLLGANLSCRWNEIQKQETRPWQSFNISRTNSVNLLDQYQLEWQKYPIQQDEQRIQDYVLVDGEKYFCAFYVDWID
jgi:hypothetical protein